MSRGCSGYGFLNLLPPVQFGAFGERGCHVTKPTVMDLSSGNLSKRCLHK